MGSPDFCPSCGASVSVNPAVPGVSPVLAQEIVAGASPVASTLEISPKSRTIATILCVAVGEFGAHRFYLGRMKSAVTMLLMSIIGSMVFIAGIAAVIVTNNNDIGYLIPLGSLFFTVPGIWSLADFIRILMGKMRDKNGKPVKKW
jgi:TM2 domain-containing membrane protein YozV